MVIIFTNSLLIIVILIKNGKIKSGSTYMNISIVIGKNIKKLMDNEDLSLRKLSESIGVSHPTLKKYVDGSQPIDSEKLMAIANYFGKPFDYFFKPKSEQISFLFRADRPMESVDGVDISMLENSLYSFNDVFGESQYTYVPPKYQVTKEQKDIDHYIAKIALEQRRLMGIENVVPNNYYKVLEDIGVHIIVKDFGENNFYAASSLSNKYGSYIFINDTESVSEERKIFSLIHEYAHLLFHSNEYGNPKQSIYKSGRSDFNEKVANKFAGYFLMPKHLVEMYINSAARIDIYEMKKYFQVSVQTVYFMLHKYNHISTKEHQDFRKKLNIYNFVDREPSPLPKIDIKDKNGKLFKKIKDLYVREEISASKISELLGIDTITTRKMLQEWRNLDERILPLK